SLTVRDSALPAVKDEGHAQRRIIGIQSEVAAGGLGELSMRFLALPLRLTKVDDQSVHTISGRPSFQLLGEPTQARKAHGYIHLARAVEYMDVAVFEIAVEAHETKVAGCQAARQLRASAPRQ